MQHKNTPKAMAIKVPEIENLVSSIERIRKQVQNINGLVPKVLLENFTKCLQALELKYVTHLVPVLECAVNDLFEEIHKNSQQRNFPVKDQNLIYVLILLIVNETAKVFAPKTMRYWQIVHVCMIDLKVTRSILTVKDFMYLDVSNDVTTDLLKDSVSKTNSNWLSAMLLVRMYAAKGTIESHLIPRGFYNKLETILHSNNDFTTTNYLLKITKYLPKVSIYKESQKGSLTVNITQRPTFLQEIPSSVTNGSLDVIYYLSSLNKTFRNLYQLKCVSSRCIDLNKSFEKGDLMFLQVIDKVMILWNSDEESLAPIYINLNNLKKFKINQELKIELEISKRNEFWNIYSLVTLDSKSESLKLSIELKKIQLVPSFLKILRFIVTHNISKISIATTTVSAVSQTADQESPKQISASLSSESQLSNIDFSRVGLNNFPNGQKLISNSKILSKKSNSSCMTSQSNLDLVPSIKEKLRNHKTKENSSLVKVPPEFFGEDPLSIEPLQSENDNIKFQEFLENNKQSISRASSIYCAQQVNTLPTPTKIINDLHKVSKRYGKKTKKQSHKRDIWDFSSSVPSSPLKKPKLVTNSIRSSKSTEPEHLAQSIIPDSLASPTLLVASRKRTNNEEPKENSDAQKGHNLFATKPQLKSKSENNNSSNNIEPTTPTKTRNQPRKLYDDLLDNSSAKKNNTIQVGESLTNDTYNREKSIRNFLDSITKLSECIKPSIGNAVDNLETQDRSLDMNTPVVGNSTTFLENDKRNVDATTVTDDSKTNNEKSLASIQKNISENSLLEDTTIKISFHEYGSMFKEHDINKQYSLIYEGMNLLSSNLINRIKKFENDIFQKQKELHEDLEMNFKHIAIQHCENLKNFNNYVKMKSDEIFKDFQ